MTNQLNKVVLAACLLIPFCVNAQRLEQANFDAKQRIKTKSIENIQCSTINQQWLKSKQESNGLNAFFVISSDSEEIYWSENFDDNIDAWTIESTNAETTNWELTQDEKGNNDFSSIYPGNVASLHLDAHYRLPKETASAISPEIEIRRSSKLNFFVGYSINWDDYCSTKVYVSTDKQLTWDKVWSTSDLPQEHKPFKWHEVSCDLKDYEGQTVSVKWEFFGYMGNIRLDSISVSYPLDSENIVRKTGELIDLIDQSEGDITSWQWSMPGANIESSTERNPSIYYTQAGSYDISLSVSNSNGEVSSVTRNSIITIEGEKPQAKIIPPTELLSWESKLPLVAPFHKVQYRDGSQGFPTAWTWSFSGVDTTAYKQTVIEEQNPQVAYSYRNTQSVGLVVENAQGISMDEREVHVDYGGLVSNVQEGDIATTFDLGDDFGFFPGTNKLDIVEYAEYYSAPARPALVYGMNVFFTNVRADELFEQIQDVKVALHKNDNGKPGEEIDFSSWRVFELNPSAGDAVPTVFEFTTPIVVDYDFFIVVSGIPEYSDIVDVRMATAKFRDHGNTAYFKKDDNWRSAAEYFPAGSNHTSYYITPLIQYWAFDILNRDKLIVNDREGVCQAVVFSTLGYDSEQTKVDASWCQITSKPNGLTLDTLDISYQELPQGVKERVANISLNNGYEELEFTLTQTRSQTSLEQVEQTKVFILNNPINNLLRIQTNESIENIEVWNIQGQLMYQSQGLKPNGVYSIDASNWAKAHYILRCSNKVSSESYIVIKN